LDRKIKNYENEKINENNRTKFEESYEIIYNLSFEFIVEHLAIVDPIQFFDNLENY
jgi:hypothetical protein